MINKILATISIAFCPIYFAYLPANSTHKEINGCGSGVTNSVTPNKPAGVSFESACNNHDKCYGIIGKSQGACDNQFHNEMLTACREAFPDGRFLGRPIRKPQRIACNGAADIYFSAVKKRGGNAYRNAQEHAKKG